MATKAEATNNLLQLAQANSNFTVDQMTSAWTKSRGTVPSRSQVDSLISASETNPLAMAIATALNCYGETPKFKFSSIFNQRENMTNISQYSSVSKSGKLFKTLRIPKAIFTVPRPIRKASGVMVLIQISNLLWRTLIPEVRPPRMFTITMIGMFKKMAGVAPNYSLSNDNVGTIIMAMKESYPNILKLYQLNKAFTAQAKDTLARIKSENTKKKEELNKLASDLISDVVSGSYAIGQLVEILNKSETLTRVQLADTTVEELIKRAGRGDVSKKYTDRTGRIRRYGGAQNLAGEEAIISEAGAPIARRALGVVMPYTQTGGAAGAAAMAEAIRKIGSRASQRGDTEEEEAIASAFQKYAAKRGKLGAEGGDEFEEALGEPQQERTEVPAANAPPGT